MTAQEFADLHTGADPLILFNIWDVGSARAAANAGAKAIATGSLALAGAQGFDDGEAIPFGQVAETVRSIVNAVKVPVTADMESGFASDHATLADNAAALRDAGAVGCNLEDQLIAAGTLRSTAEQAKRIGLVRAAGLFVNARTDVFLGPLMAGEDPNRPELVDEAVMRAAAYRDAGAGCFFAPGLSDPDCIADLAARIAMPLNIMRLPGMVSNAELAKLGAARISYGPGPWRDAMAMVEKAARDAFSA